MEDISPSAIKEGNKTLEGTWIIKKVGQQNGALLAENYGELTFSPEDLDLLQGALSFKENNAKTTVETSYAFTLNVSDDQIEFLYLHFDPSYNVLIEGEYQIMELSKERILMEEPFKPEDGLTIEMVKKVVE
ncbi:hypothetical protein GCM10023331_22210 [Algivirga pacifica]|uniref:Lipocalin-like domain-containing protein n=2 Tax=Algivirga pacifica TaxID=1162670 RepID=A0ABP9DBT4_9BACT